MGTEGKTFAPVLPIPVDNHTISKSENHLDTREKPCIFYYILSRNFTIEDVEKEQQNHKHIPRDIKFFSPEGKEIRYFVDHDTPSDGNANEFIPIVCHEINETTTST